MLRKKSILFTLCKTVKNYQNLQKIFRSTSSIASYIKYDSNNTFYSPYSEVTIPDVSFTDFIFNKLENHARNIALVNSETGQEFTCENVRTLSIKFGSALTRLGFEKGDVIGLVSPNCPEYAITFLGILAAGLVPSTINFSYTADEIRYQLLNSDCVGVVCHEEKMSVLREACKHVSHDKDVSQGKYMLHIRHVICIGKTDQENVLRLNNLLKDDGNGLNKNLQINAREDLIALPYSSGTTGLPKGVMLTHRNLVANLHQSLHPDCCFLNIYDGGKEVLIGVLPMYHVYGMTVCMGLSLAIGSKLVTMKKFAKNDYISVLEKYHPTILFLVPPLMSFLESSSSVHKNHLSSVTAIICGAAPIGDTLLAKFFNKFGSHFEYLEGFGLTETSPLALLTPKNRLAAGSCGVPIPNTQIKIIDMETGVPIGPGMGEGELCVRGPQVMKGYYKNEKATRDSIDSEGWFHTGDIARVDGDGNFYIVDRLKELIKVKGSQVAPAELENLLRQHPSVEDVAVIGIPDDLCGEVPLAFIVRAEKDGESVAKPAVKNRENDELAENLKHFVSQKVAPFKRIRKVTFIDEIPKSAAGKILRKDLRKRV